MPLVKQQVWVNKKTADLLLLTINPCGCHPHDVLVERRDPWCNRKQEYTVSFKSADHRRRYFRKYSERVGSF